MGRRRRERRKRGSRNKEGGEAAAGGRTEEEDERKLQQEERKEDREEGRRREEGTLPVTLLQESPGQRATCLPSNHPFTSSHPAMPVSQWFHQKFAVKNLPANAGDKRQGFYPWLRKIPLRKAWQPTPESVSGESHG